MKKKLIFNKDYFIEATIYQNNLSKGLQFFSHTLLLLIILLMGCTITVNDEQPEIKALTATVSVSSIQETVPSVEVTPTLTTTPTATMPPMATATAQLEGASTPTPEPTLEDMFDWANEKLFTFKPDGIYQIALDTGDSEVIVTRKEGWQLFSAKFSYDGREAVYWFVEDGVYQVWAVNMVSGDTRQLLSIVDNGFTRPVGNWLGQGKFFELGIWGEDENGVPLVVQWYLFDIQRGEIVGTADDSPGTRICHTLAVSPKSNQAATWCSFDSQFETQREYTVIEANGESWQTTTAPEQVLLETLGTDGRHIWSPDGNYVLIPSSLNATLVYVPESRVSQLFENDSSSINAFTSRFSPNSKLLSYMHGVCEYDNLCIKLIGIESKSIVWESSGLFSPPVGIYAWSPDARFFVLEAKDNTFIIDISDFSVVKTLPNYLITTGEVAWLDN